MHDDVSVSAEYKQVDRGLVESLPKVVLHDHLDGGLRPGTVVELAKAAGYTGVPDVGTEAVGAWFRDKANAGSLSGYLEGFAHTVAVMQTREALIRVAREAVEDLAEDNCVYAELRCAPELHTSAGLSLQDVVDAVGEGLRAGEIAAEAHGKQITARLLICALRHADNVAEIAQLAADNYHPDSTEHPVVGFDIAGEEVGSLVERYGEVFAHLRACMVPVTIHAGEDADTASVADALRVGACRIGHGVQLAEDFTADTEGIHPGSVAAWVRDRRIPLELCPTSNVQTRAVNELADHPLPFLHGMGFACTVNPDNRLMSGVSMTDEMMVLVSTFGYGVTELADLTITAMEAAFIPWPQRQEILQQRILPVYQQLADDADTANTAGD